jgi:hypothetical protein
LGIHQAAGDNQARHGVIMGVDFFRQRAHLVGGYPASVRGSIRPLALPGLDDHGLEFGNPGARRVGDLGVAEHAG